MRSPLLFAALAASLAAPAGAAHAGDPPVTQCAVTASTSAVMVTLSRLPDAPLTVSLGADDGSVIELVFDRATGDAPHRVVRTPAGRLRIAISGDPLLLPSGDSKGSIRLQQTASFDACAAGATSVTAKVSWGAFLKSAEVTAQPLLITIEAIAPPRVEAALALTGAPTAAGMRGLGLDSAIPAAVTEILQLLAEIAVDKAKSEAMRLFKDKVVTQVCDRLQLNLVDGKTAAPLLPATCAQLENLRLGDLGGSAAALVTALREDVAGTVAPALFTRLQAELLGRSMDPALVSLVTRLAVRAASGGLSADEIKMALLAFVDSKTPAGSVESELLHAVVEVAIQCAVQGCTPADVLRELKESLAKVKWMARIVLEQVVAAALGELDKVAIDKNATQAAKEQAARAARGLRALTGEDYVALAAALDETLSALMTAEAPDLNTIMERVHKELAAKLSAHNGNLENVLEAVKPVLVSQLKRIGQELLTQVKSHNSPDGSRLAKALPALAALAVRARAVLQPPAGTTPRATASEAAQIFFDLLDITCADGAATCAQRVHQFRDVVVGSIEADYIRALGGVSALLRAIYEKKEMGEPEAKAARAALGLVASVMSYVETYKATTGEPPAEARARRKKALEALITAGTDRSGRAGGWIVSLGTTVGFVGGFRRLAGAIDSAHTDSAAYDLRLPLGLTAYRMAGDDGKKHCPIRPDGFLIHASFADLALFVPSSADAAKPERNWSDFVAVGAQIGAGWGKQLPFVIGADISWAPGLVYKYEYKDNSYESRGVFRVGGFIGFNVPFLDLN